MKLCLYKLNLSTKIEENSPRITQISQTIIICVILEICDKKINHLNVYPSKLLENAVSELSKLPGIGRKTALRLALHLLKQDVSEVEAFGKAVIKLRNEIIYCRDCHNISDSEICAICASPKRDHSIVCFPDREGGKTS